MVASTPTRHYDVTLALVLCDELGQNVVRCLRQIGFCEIDGVLEYRFAQPHFRQYVVEFLPLPMWMVIGR